MSLAAFMYRFSRNSGGPHRPETLTISAGLSWDSFTLYFEAYSILFLFSAKRCPSFESWQPRNRDSIPMGTVTFLFGKTAIPSGASTFYPLRISAVSWPKVAGVRS